MAKLTTRCGSISGTRYCCCRKYSRHRRPPRSPDWPGQPRAVAMQTVCLIQSVTVPGLSASRTPTIASPCSSPSMRYRSMSVSRREAKKEILELLLLGEGSGQDARVLSAARPAIVVTSTGTSRGAMPDSYGTGPNRHRCFASRVATSMLPLDIWVRHRRRWAHRELLQRRSTDQDLRQHQQCGGHRQNPQVAQIAVKNDTALYNRHQRTSGRRLSAWISV